jgi:hypothetical protein
MFSFVANILMTLNASVFGFVRISQYVLMRASCTRRKRLAQQIIVAVEASFGWDMLDNLLTNNFTVIFRSEFVFVHILYAGIALSRNMGKELIFSRQMAVNAFYPKTESVGSVG